MRRRRTSKSRYHDNFWYAPSRPIDVQYGLRTSKKQGKIGETWWSQRWIRALEEMQMGARLARGRAYARRGQVLDIDVQAGQVTAHVQGSRPTPYAIEIRLHTLTEKEWRAVITALSAQALFAAKLLAGEMPQEIESVFDTAHVHLFPKSSDDLKTKCSCPDWANPCKHIAAVYYLLADSFDKDPFLLFTLRGKSKDDVLAALRDERGGAAHNEQPQVADEPPGGELEAAWLNDFWQPGASTRQFVIRPARPAVHMALLARLGQGPFTEIKPADVFSTAYDMMSATALEVAEQ